MKKEKWKDAFSDAVNEIADEYVADLKLTEGKKGGERRMNRVFISIAAVAAAAALFMGGRAVFSAVRPETVKDGQTADSGQENGKDAGMTETEGKDHEPIKAALLAAPEYPETVKIRSEADLMDQDLQEKMFQERKKRMEAGKVLSGMDLSLYRETLKRMLSESEETNPLCAPANVYLALAMLSECSGGRTRDQILNALKADDQETARAFARNLTLANYLDSGMTTSHFSNSVWMNDAFTYHEETLKTLAEDYQASVYQGTMGDPDYDEALRDWVNGETGDFLREQVADLQMDPEGAVDLLSTVYLRAMWMNPFDPSKTAEGIFHGTEIDETVPFMNQVTESLYYYGEHFGAIRLSLGEEHAMWLLLPDEGVDVRTLPEDEEALSLLVNSGEAALYEEWQDRSAYTIVHLSLPKFDLSAKNDLKGLFEDLGITDVFSPEKADLATLIASEDPVWLSKVENGIRVAIDEEGVTAASYIDLQLAGAAEPQDEVHFTLDRPFLFCIQGIRSQAPLFAGIVEQP